MAAVDDLSRRASNLPAKSRSTTLRVLALGIVLGVAALFPAWLEGLTELSRGRRRPVHARPMPSRRCRQRLPWRRASLLRRPIAGSVQGGRMRDPVREREPVQRRAPVHACGLRGGDVRHHGGRPSDGPGGRQSVHGGALPRWEGRLVAETEWIGMCGWCV
jgi:hypothetical protein